MAGGFDEYLLSWSRAGPELNGRGSYTCSVHHPPTVNGSLFFSPFMPLNYCPPTPFTGIAFLEQREALLRRENGCQR